MSKVEYIRGGDESLVYTGEQVKKNTEVETLFGTILVTEGNYVFTDKDGNKFGVAEAEVGSLYTPVASTKKKTKD